jgi:hypothetical protein
MKDLKKTLGESTEKIEREAANFIGEYYFSLEPWQRGLLVLGIISLTVLTIYWLTKEDKNKLREARREAAMEEKWLKQMALLKKFKE